MKTIEIKADGYTLDPAWAVVGTAGSRGVAQLKFIFDSVWDGLSSRVTFFPADGSDAVSVIMTDGIAALPAELTAAAGTAEYVVDGVKDAQTLISLTGKLRILSTLEPGGEPVTEPTAGEVEQVRSIMQEVLENIGAAAGKTDLVSNATDGNIAALNGDGNLTDSGIAASEVLTAHPAVTLTEVTSAVVSPVPGDTFTAADGIIRDSFGHVTGISTKTVKLPERRGVSFGTLISRPIAEFGTYTTPGMLEVNVSGKYCITNTEQNGDSIYYEINSNPPGNDGSIELAFRDSEEVYLDASDTLTLSGSFTVTFVCYTAGNGFAVGDRYINSESGDVFKCVGTEGDRSLFEYELSLKNRAGNIAIADAQSNFITSDLESVLSELAESVHTVSESASVAETSAQEALQIANTVSEAQAGYGTSCSQNVSADGYYPEMAVGTADNLAGKGNGVPASFTYRTTGGTADVADGTATIKSIKGNTIVWNQLVDELPATQTIGGITFTNNGNGSITANGTASEDVTLPLANGQRLPYTKLIVSGCPAGGGEAAFSLQEGWTSAVDTGNGAMVTTNEMGAYIVIIVIANGATVNATFTPQVFDITRMFGSGNEPTSVAEFKALYPNSYYEYDAGSLKSFVCTGIKTVGFNMFDAETKLMAISGAAKAREYYSFGSYNWNNAYENTPLIDIPKGYTGQIQITLNAYASNTTASPSVIIKYSDNTQSVCYFATTTTDAAYNFISTEGKTVASVNSCFSNVGTVYVKDFCIHLCWSGVRNGEYEDYWTQTRSLPVETYFPDGIRRAGTTYDELTADKAITRVVAVDMGTLTWYRWQNTLMYAALPDKRLGVNNVVCVQYPTHNGGWTTLPSGKICGSNASHDVNIKDDNYTDPALFKAAMSGKYLFYEKETPTEVNISMPLNLSYHVSDFGTEQIVTAENEVMTPCVMDVVYGLNAVDTIRRLPCNYVATTDQTLTPAQTAQILSNLGISDMARTVTAPATAVSAGTTGSIAYDAEYLYICTATNTWRRVALSSWS